MGKYKILLIMRFFVLNIIDEYKYYTSGSFVVSWFTLITHTSIFKCDIELHQ